MAQVVGSEIIAMPLAILDSVLLECEGRGLLTPKLINNIPLTKTNISKIPLIYYTSEAYKY